MTGFSAAATSAILGGAIAVGMTAITAIVDAAMARRTAVRSLTLATARGSGMRLVGALAGVSIGVMLDPPSVAVFVVSFLAAFIAAHAILIFGFGRGAEPIGSRR